MAQDQNHSAHTEGGFPWKYVIGFGLSIVLTLLAFWAAFASGMSKGAILTSIIILAFVQAGIQLFMFMHVTETDDGKVQAGNMIHAFVAFIIVVAGSIWVMSFGMHYMH